MPRRARRRRKVEWRYDPANPEMVVCTRVLINRGGVYERIVVELTPAEMSSVCAQSLRMTELDPRKVQWNKDPLYDAANKLRNRRLARNKATTKE